MHSGRYDKSVVIGDECRNGTVKEPIEVLANVDAVLSVEGDGPVVEVRGAHWHFYGLEITPGESKGPAFMSYGKGAHDILLDREGQELTGAEGIEIQETRMGNNRQDLNGQRRRRVNLSSPAFFISRLS